MQKSSPRQLGFTLVELMVAMVVGMVVVMALMTVTSNYEKSKRQVQGNTAMGFNVGYTSYDLDRQIRSAGSGYLSGALDESALINPEVAADVSAYRRALGCTVGLIYNGVQKLPLTSALVAPFASVPLRVRMIPALIHAGIGGGGSDVIAVMSGTSGVGEVPLNVRSAGMSATQVNMNGAVAIKADDLMLLVETNRRCLMTQVATGYTAAGAGTVVPLGGLYYAATIDGSSLTDYGKGVDASGAVVDKSVTSLLLMGNANNLPQFRLYGVDTNHMLWSYDLLGAINPGANFPVAENVQDMRALYGIDTNYDGTIDNWVSPAVAPYRVQDLTDGSAAAQGRLLQIRAIRIAMLVHSDRVEKPYQLPGDYISAASFPYFTDLGALASTFAITGADLQRHYKVVDFTVPMRNALNLPRTYALASTVIPAPPPVYVLPASQATP